MTLNSIVALFVAMAILAAIPSLSVFAVIAKTTTAGLAHGGATALGIVAGDICFILLAIYGLVALVSHLSSLFLLLKYLGGSYLIFLGISLWRSKLREDATATEANSAESSLLASFLSGLAITLGDQKAILFYMGFLPAFLDLSRVTLGETGVIIAIAFFTVGGVKLAYAVLADRGRLIFAQGKARRMIQAIAGCTMVGAGLVLILKP